MVDRHNGDRAGSITLNDPDMTFSLGAIGIFMTSHNGNRACVMTLYIPEVLLHNMTKS